MGGPGGGGFRGGGARFGGPPPAGGLRGQAAGLPGAAGGGAAGAPGATTAGGGPGGGGRGGADSATQAAAIAYVRAHGGGTIATSSQNSTSAQVIAGADIAAIGGFSGRESQVSASWLADAVQHGQIRWVLAGSGGGPRGVNDARTGSSDVMALVQQVCAPTSSTSLYDCAGQASALRSGG
jgi:hypothetical protein